MEKHLGAHRGEHRAVNATIHLIVTPYPGQSSSAEQPCSGKRGSILGEQFRLFPGRYFLMSQPPARVNLKKPSMVDFRASVTAFCLLAPQFLIPLFELLAGYFAIAHCRSDIGMPQPFLKHSDTVSRIILLHSHDGETVSQAVWTHPMHPTAFRV